jgi:hypothetical protein
VVNDLPKEICMTDNNFFVSKASVRYLKQRAERYLPHVASSHLTEALAHSMGFNTHAALTSKLNQNATVEVLQPSKALMTQRLRELGYPDPPSSAPILPDFGHDMAFGKKSRVHRPETIRWNAWRNLMVAAINAGLNQRLFGLSPDDNWWPGFVSYQEQNDDFVYRFELEGFGAVVAKVSLISGDELSVYVILRPKSKDVTPSFYSSLREGDAYAHGWLERRLGVWLQNGGEAFKCKRLVLQALAKSRHQAHGYADLGPFIM